MATFLIWRLRDTQQDKFRWAPQQSTPTFPLKLSDYREDGLVDADSVYEVWHRLRKENRDLRVGDVVVDENGKVSICKYIGMEPAEWIVTDMEPQAAKETPVAQQEYLA